MSGWGWAKAENVCGRDIYDDDGNVIGVCDLTDAHTWINKRPCSTKAQRQQLRAQQRAAGFTPEVQRAAIDNAPSEAFLRPDDIPGPRDLALRALTRASERGEIRNVLGSLYWKGAEPDGETVVHELYGWVGCGPAGKSALHFWGLKNRKPDKFHFTSHRAARWFHWAEFTQRTGKARKELHWAELGLLEVLRERPYLDEAALQALARRVIDAEGVTFRIHEVARAAATEPREVREGVGCLLGAMDVADPDLVAMRDRYLPDGL